MSLRKIVLFGVLISIVACSKPLARFTMNADEEPIAPTRVSFTNESEKAETYYWDFGDGNSSEEFEPEHSYNLSGNYTVVLTAIKGNKKTMEEKDIYVKAPETCLVKMETTMGEMLIELSDLTPLHRDNFLKLAEEGYYEGLLFHRVIKGFMIQGGDPDSKNAPAGKRLGVGGPGYKVDAEFVEHLAHVKGAIAAARQGGSINPEKRSSGSQFYIVQGGSVSEEMLDRNEMQKGIVYSDDLRKEYVENGGTPFLDSDYTVFGKVIKGLDIIDDIAATSTDSADRPREDVKILKVTVIK